MRPYIAELAEMAECYVSVYPNAGLPNAFGQYDELPDETGALLRDFVASGFANIIGGCCGTTPDHIAAVRKAAEGLTPRAAARECVASGLAGSPRRAGRRLHAAFRLKPEQSVTTRSSPASRR